MEAAEGLCAWLNGDRRGAYSWVPEKVRVLDIGCGFGETLAYHKSRGCDVYGVEADENIKRVAEKFAFKVHVGLFDPACYEPNFFDYVTLDQVIEHVTDPVETLQGVAGVLKSGGRAILSMPNADGWGAKLFGRRWINWHAPYHLQHFNRDSIRLAAEKSGLCVEKSVTLTSSDWLHLQWIHLLTCPGEGHPSIFWSPKAQGTPLQKFLLRGLFVFHLSKINHLITRFFDWLSLGDNMLVVLRKP